MRILEIGKPREHIRFCSNCLGDIVIKKSAWTSWGEGADPANHIALSICRCQSPKRTPLHVIAANPVVWAAFVEHHLRESGCLICIERSELPADLLERIGNS